jgi:hypothetical protein
MFIFAAVKTRQLIAVMDTLWHTHKNASHCQTRQLITVMGTIEEKIL